MIAVLQRVSQARVRVGGRECAAMGAGILSMLAFERGDGAGQVAPLIGRVLNCRLFDDGSGRLGLSLFEFEDAGLLLVPQFTLAADTAKGNRPDFSLALEPQAASNLFALAVGEARSRLPDRRVASGVFGARMEVESINEGPVTLIYRSG